MTITDVILIIAGVIVSLVIVLFVSDKGIYYNTMKIPWFDLWIFQNNERIKRIKIKMQGDEWYITKKEFLGSTLQGAFKLPVGEDFKNVFKKGVRYFLLYDVANANYLIPSDKETVKQFDYMKFRPSAIPPDVMKTLLEEKTVKDIAAPPRSKFDELAPYLVIGMFLVFALLLLWIWKG